MTLKNMPKSSKLDLIYYINIYRNKEGDSGKGEIYQFYSKNKDENQNKDKNQNRDTQKVAIVNNEPIVVTHDFKNNNYNINNALSKNELLKKAKLYQISKRTKMSKAQLIRRITLYEKIGLTEKEWIELLGTNWKKNSGKFWYQNEENGIIIGESYEFEKYLQEEKKLKDFIEIKDIRKLFQPNLKDIKRNKKNGISLLNIDGIWYSIPQISIALRFLYPRINFKCFQNIHSGTLMLKADTKTALICPSLQEKK